ncbi:MAG: exo-alpha-sialidase [Pseudomonadota bacterium]
MATRVLVLLGTKKGAFVLTGDAGRRDWSLDGPFCGCAPVNHVAADLATGVLHAAGGDGWSGPGVWRSDDRGQSWTKYDEGLTYADGEPAITSVWSLACGPGVLYAGVQPAGLFASTDGGRSWTHVRALRDHPSREHWQPGGAGLILHALVLDPADERRLWVGISAAGVFHSADGGASFEPRNRGTRCDFLPEEMRYPDYGQCVHSLAQAPGDGEWLYQQNHCGTYRSRDGGRRWESIEAGLPSSFGFASAVHPRDPLTFYTAPLNGDIVGRYMPDAKAAVWRTRDGGDSWTALRQGLPQENCYFGVLRRAMATDPLTPAGVYFGTNTGTLYASVDEGDRWHRIAEHLPTICSVTTVLAAD